MRVTEIRLSIFNACESLEDPDPYTEDEECNDCSND